MEQETIEVDVKPYDTIFFYIIWRDIHMESEALIRLQQ